MDMSGRVVLHCQHNALVHDQRGPVLELEVSHEIWPKQDATKGDIEDRVRVVAVDSDELATEPHVLKSKFPKLYVYCIILCTCLLLCIYYYTS